MNTLNMPGFTAEASLYQTSRSDRSVVAVGGIGCGEQKVVAQLPPGGGGPGGCVTGCFRDYTNCKRDCRVWAEDGFLRNYCDAACATLFNGCLDQCRVRQGPGGA